LFVERHAKSALEQQLRLVSPVPGEASL
jgi:hypothetical protein